MTTQSEDIDLDFRPAARFWPIDAEVALLASIKGAARRERARQLIEAGQLDQLSGFFSKSSLDPDEREAWGAIHPAMMGGEYLPDLEDREIEVARIHIDSTTGDVTSLRARLEGDRIHYRVVDEYDGDTLEEPTTLTSSLPLTLGELERFFLSAWPLRGVLEMNELDRSGALAFTHPSSELYPQFEALVRHRICEWLEDWDVEDEEEPDAPED